MGLGNMSEHKYAYCLMPRDMTAARTLLLMLLLYQNATASHECSDKLLDTTCLL